MAASLALDSRDVALELRALLRDMDPARWSDAMRVELEARLVQLRAHVQELVNKTWSDAQSILERLDKLVELLDDAPTADDARAAWMAFRASMQPEYEHLVASLAAFDVHVPSLRPTNYVRNVFHVGNAVWVLCLVEYVLTTPARLLGVALFGAVWAWSMEIGRRTSPGVNTFLMKVFGPVAHPHEAHRIKESTLKRYQQRIGVWRGSDIAGALASRLRRQDIQHVMLEWEAHDHMARTSVRVLCQVFVSAWRWGIREGMAPPLDLTRLSPPRKPGEYVYRSYTPTRDEVASVLRHIPAESHRSAVHLMALTGARIGEALAATVGDYDGVVLKLKGKTGPREFPVTGELRKLLERLSDGRQPDERLCRMRDGRRVNHALIRACEAAEIEEFTPHALRRRVVMDLLKITDPATVGKLTGHSPQILLRDYVRPSADDLRNVVARAPLSIEDRGKVVQLLAQSTGTLSGDDDE